MIAQPPPHTFCSATWFGGKRPRGGMVPTRAPPAAGCFSFTSGISAAPARSLTAFCARARMLVGMYVSVYVRA